MIHTESSVKIYCTTEYSRFRMINGNRQLVEPNIKRIIREIHHGNNMMPYSPIQVKENKDRLDILDGQHRFYICKKLNMPVFYIIIKEEKSMPDIARINSNVEKWKNNDYLNCYIQQGNKNYELLQQFIDAYHFPFSISIILLATGNAGVEGSNQVLNHAFKNGTFIVEQWKAAVDLAENCKKFNASPLWRERGFIIALYRILKAGLVTIDDLLAAFKKRPEMLTKQPGFKDYIYNLEQIVNIGKQKRIVII